MKAMKTRFSVVVPVYNRQELVRLAIDSVLSQTLPDYELIVVDDGSTDRTPEVLRSYGARIRVIRQENQGPEVARDLGATMANGEYIALLDSDDLLLPRALATYDRIIRALDSPALIIGSVTYFQDGQSIQPESGGDLDIEVLKHRDYLSKDVAVGLWGSNVVVKKSVLEQAGGMRHSTPTTFHMDILDLVLRVGTYGPCVLVNRPALMAYRTHDTNSIHNVEAMVRGLYPVLEAEQRGQYPGGRSRRFDRYACIGGFTWCYFKHALRDGRPRMAFKLLIDTSPMILAGALKKIRGRLRGACRPVRLAVE
jgi:glycosyltransferase involved in cell wall biosynthesis